MCDKRKRPRKFYHNFSTLVMKHFFLIVALTITGLYNVSVTQAEESEDDLETYEPSASPSLSISPSSMPSSSLMPSSNPSLTSVPSYNPSDSPSLSRSPSSNPSSSLMPSSDPSLSFLPSLSIHPSANPTGSPSIQPSESFNPTISIFPSTKPSESFNPSISSVPSTKPSISYLPSRSSYPSASVLPSSNPSESLNPTLSLVPSTDPSSWPTSQPSKSHSPSISTLPSSQPSISMVPSTSSNPTESLNPTGYPSLLPSYQPSLSSEPSVSHIPTSFPSGAPSLNPAATYRTTLAIRVVAADLSTTASASKLSDQIFGETDFSLFSQMEACSYGNLIFLPFKGSTETGEEISNGVGEVTIENNANGTSAAMLRSVVQSAAETKYGDLESQFDNVLFCLPPGTILQGGTDWVGFALMNHWMSTYNDLYCTYPSALMHEIGHNLGLGHSDEDYGDESCMMGFSYELEDGPYQCFNGAKSWELGWYSESHLSINITELSDWDSYDVNITGAADFNGRSDQTVIIQITGSSSGLDYYIAFNRKTGMNSGTQEGGDKVLITNRETGDGIAVDSTLVAELEDGDEYFIHSKDFEPNVVIHVNTINLEADPAYASLYISKYHKICYSDSYCNDRDTCTVDTCVQQTGSIIFPDPVNAGQCNYETLPCTECGAKIGVTIVTNEYPEYTTWSLYDIDKKMEVLAGGPYDENYTVFNTEKCLQLGDYSFTINDASNSSLSSPEYSLSIQGKVTMSNSDLLSFRQLETRSVDKVFVQSTTDFGSSATQTFDIVCTEEECKDYDACTEDIFDPETRLCLYQPAETCPNATKFTVNITTDEYGDETSWSIINLHDKKLVLNGGPYIGFGRKKKHSNTKRRRRLTNDDGTATYLTDLYLEDSFYEFNINDEFGDGMCCEYGNGGYVIGLNDVEVVTGGEFEYNAKTSYNLNVCESDSDCDDFDGCTEDVCQENTCIYSQMDCEDCGKVKVAVYIYTDWIPEEISWIVSTGSIGTGDVVMSGNSYSDTEYLYVETKCLDLGAYTFSIFDSGGNGMCCEMGKGYYKMTVGENNVQLFEGGDFDLIEEVTFNVDTTPSDKPSILPSIMPSIVPTKMPSMSLLPSSSQLPSSSLYPSSQPSKSPSKSSAPTISIVPSASMHPSNYPSLSVHPSYHPSSTPSRLPSESMIPSANPSMADYSSCLSVKVKTDNYPAEITWEVVDNSNGNIILEGGPYNDASTAYSSMHCIEKGLYSFIIYDRLGSGSLFDGYYTLRIDNTVIKSVSSFERTETTFFTISDTFEPTSSTNPSSNPSEQNLPTAMPSLSMNPSKRPSVSPTVAPSQSPSASIIPTIIPSNIPSKEPSLDPSTSLSPSTIPTNEPTKTPSLNPSVSQLPTVSQKPSFSIPIPTSFPSYSPSNNPSYEPSLNPSVGPSNVHSSSPSNIPSYVPSTSPSDIPSGMPSSSSSPSSRFAIYSCPDLPTRQPTSKPSISNYPSIHISKSIKPSNAPSVVQSDIPSLTPSTSPSLSSSPSLSFAPSPPPTNKPTNVPTNKPTNVPTNPPTNIPTNQPTLNPTTSNPTSSPSSVPTFISQLTDAPSTNLNNPTSSSPSESNQQSFNPTPSDNLLPTNVPTNSPTNTPTTQPQSTAPSPATSLTTKAPTQAPTLASVTSTYQQSFAGSDDLTVMNSSQIAVYEANMASGAATLTISTQIASSYDANKTSHATTTSSTTTMNNIVCKITDQKLESITNISPTNPLQVLTKMLTIEYDLTVFHESRSEIELYNEQYVDQISIHHDEIKQALVKMEVDVQQVFDTIQISTSAPSVYPTVHNSTIPTTSPTVQPSKSPKPTNENIIVQTTKPTESTSKPKKKKKSKKEKKKQKKKKQSKKQKKEKKKQKKKKNEPTNQTAPPRPVINKDEQNKQKTKKKKKEKN